MKLMKNLCVISINKTRACVAYVTSFIGLRK